MKRLLPTLALSFICFGMFGQALYWNSLLKESGGQYSAVFESHVDANKNLFIGGQFNSNVDFDPDDNSTYSINSAGTQDVFFGKYTDYGEYIWVKHIDAFDEAGLGGMVVDGNNNIYITGWFRDTIDLDPSSTQSLYAVPSGTEGFYMSVYNSSGDLSWARHIESSNHVWSEDMVRDNNGNRFIVGRTSGVTDFDHSGGVSTISTPHDYFFIAKYNSSGAFVDVVSIGSSTTGQSYELSGVEIDGSGNIYLYGVMKGTIDFDPSAGVANVTPSGNSDCFIAKYNNSLQYQWAYNLGGSSDEEESMALTINGSKMFVGVPYLGTVDANLKSGTQTYNSKGNYDVLLARYDLSANLQSSGSIGGTSFENVREIVYYNSDSIYYTGNFTGTADFDPGSGTKNLSFGGNLSVYFAGYSESFNYQFASRIAGTGHIWSTNIDRIGRYPVIFGRLVSGSADFDDAWGVTASYNGPASFFAKYQECGEIFIELEGTNDATCGEKDGNAEVTGNGGSGNFSYTWTSGSTDKIADSLRSGTYFVTVTDTILGCSSVSDPIIINNSNGPSITVQAKVNVSCHGGTDGAIIIDVSGGNTPYTYSWSNGSTNKNISLLKAGFYELTVTDNAGCKSTTRIEITQPNPISVTSIASEPSCGNSDGALTAVAQGGANPYTYSWTPGGTGGTQFSLGAGVYRVEVTDNNGCTYTEAIALSDEFAPDVSVNSITNATCGGSGGAIDINVTGGTPSYSYAWSNSATTQDISGLQPGEYDLVLTDGASCKAAFTAKVEAIKGVAPQICMVDVDSINGRAQVIWEKPSTPGAIDYYNIYRETTSQNVYDWIDSVDFGALSQYEDSYADTWVRPWSYKISYTDTCGIVSEQSDQHTTIHVVVTRNPQGHHNILYTDYKGNFSFAKYFCNRYRDSTGFMLIDSFPRGQYTYVDTASFVSTPDLYYTISVDHPAGCLPTEAQTRNSARSNRGSISPPSFSDDTTSVQTVKMDLSEYTVYPNPNDGLFTVDINTAFSGYMNVQLVDMHGVIVMRDRKMVYAGQNSIKFDVQNVSSGLYFLQLDLNNERSFARVMITERE